ncbi:MAG TPA: chaperonin GroEL [Planctomycetes bacterium]|nr:chaperonin GroEL [Planctomycetota bacterium]HIK81724.1 chaperonin GroEL [Planctomycetota bacterium]
MSKQILFEDDARRHLREGIRTLAKAVKVTYGPGGRNVLLEKSMGKSQLTKDGQTVSREIEVEKPFENMGARLINEVANKTNKEVGDGTTSSIILAEAMVERGGRFAMTGVSPVELRIGIEKAVATAVRELEAISSPVKKRQEVVQVGTIAANEAELGKMFGDAIHRVGEKGVVTVEENDGVETSLDLVEGLEIDKGWISQYFITDRVAGVCVLEKPWILFTDHKISSIQDLLPVLEQVVATRRPLAIIAEDVEGEALAGLLLNKLRGVMDVVAIKAPGFGDRRKALLEDMAIVTGGQMIAKDTGVQWEQVGKEQLGTVRKLEVSKDRTLFYRGTGNQQAIDQRCAQIEAQIEQTQSNYDREKLEERLARIMGKIAVIRVGGATELEIKERKSRAEDALSATRAAMSEGIVPGAGTAFLQISEKVAATRVSGDARFGVQVVADALLEPTAQLARNCGFDGPAIVAEVMEYEDIEMGFDGVKGKVVDLVRAGVVDPTKVLRVALQNAASVAGLYLTSDTAIADLEKDEIAVDGALV